MAKRRASSGNPAEPTARPAGQIPAKPARCPVIGLGASAGGLEAVTAFLGGVPPKSGAAYVVVQHLDPTQDSLLVDLLGRSCGMPVLEVVDGMAVQPDHVYVIPPDRDLLLRQGALRLGEPRGARGHRMPIDSFFASLAEEQQGVGVVLSGSGSDGTLGLMAIRECGGVTAVQDPDTAASPDMPRSAIEGGLTDLVAPARDLPGQVLMALQAARRQRADLSRSDRDGLLLTQVLGLLKAQTGHDFSLYKKTTLYRRIERRMGLRRITHLRAYVEFLQQNPTEGSLLLKELLIGVTRFFRDPEVWEQLRDEIATRLLAPRPAGGVLRAWVPGCATGEEAYTLAMVFREAVEAAATPVPCTLQIFATDLNQAAIDHARRGAYPPGIAAMMSPERLQRFFVPDVRGGYRVSKEIREMVIFAPHSLLADPPFTKLDLLVCRNLMIYLAPEVHETLLQRFHFSINPDGILLLGSSESVGTATDLFVPLAGYGQLYQRLNAPLHPTKVGISLATAPTTPLVPLARNADPMAAHVIANLQNLVDQLLLQRYAPAAVLVTGTGDILHISGKTGRYLEPAAGKANWNVLAMARDGLSSVMSEAFYDAQRRQTTVTLTATQIGDDGGPRAVDITVQPLVEPASMKGMVLIVFTDVTVPVMPVGQDDRTERQSERLKTMELALQAARDELQTTREEMQTSREELTSTNEELQSTNEELTTSAEELRTMNEELVRARSAAESALARYTDLFDSAPVGYFTVDRGGVIVQANLAGSELLGLGRERPAGGRLALFVVEAERDAFLDCLERAFRTHEPHTCEVGLWREKGAPRRVRISALAGEDARTCRVVVADVSEIRETQAALAESEERYRMLWETTTDAIIVLDEQSVIRYANTAMHTIFGYDQAEVIGRDLAMLQPEHLRNRHRQGIARYLATHEKRLNWRATQTTALHRDGHEFPIEISFSHVTIGGKQLFAGFLRDVTERVRAENALRESEERYRRIVENAHEGIWTIDAQACTTFTNARMAEMLGYTVEEMKGRHLSEFMDAEVWADAQRSMVGRAQGRSETKEMRYRRKDGSALWALIAASPIFAADGSFQGATALVTDITDRRRMEEELRHAQKMEAVGRLAGGIAHDFNNQLTVIEGYGTLAMGRSTDHNVAKCLAYIVSAAGRSAALVRQLLTFSRKGHHAFAPLDVHRLIDEVVEMLGRSVPKNIRIERDLRAGDPMVQGDVSLLQNVLLNLALNARDAMPDGGELRYATELVELDAERAARLGGGLPGGRYLRLTVSDTGQGMSQEVQRHLFEPFFSTKGPGQGTGLGLASVYGTVTQHRGGIEVESAVGRGSHFRLFLPSSDERVAPPSQVPSASPPSALQGSGSVLVVDDEEVVAALVADTLEGAGYRVHCTHDGAQALEHYRAHWASVDLIVLDMNMPVMSGPETFAALRAVNPGAKVLVISGYSEGRGVEGVMRGGAQAFLSKPFRPDTLLEHVAQILGVRRA
jgi:two-component system, chemotaxis family, CheB/CheR fusion protein